MIVSLPHALIVPAAVQVSSTKAEALDMMATEKTVHLWWSEERKGSTWCVIANRSSVSPVRPFLFTCWRKALSLKESALALFSCALISCSEESVESGRRHLSFSHQCFFTILLAITFKFIFQTSAYIILCRSDLSGQVLLTFLSTCLFWLTVPILLNLLPHCHPICSDHPKWCITPPECHPANKINLFCFFCHCLTSV